MQFHNLVIDEHLAPSPLTGQRFMRRVNATPSKDGYGHETWIMPCDVGTHLVVASSSSDGIIICNACVTVVVKKQQEDEQVSTILIRLLREEKDKYILQLQSKEETTPSTLLVVVLLSADAVDVPLLLSREDCAFLGRELRIAALATSASDVVVVKDDDDDGVVLPPPFATLRRCDATSFPSHGRTTVSSCSSSCSSVILPLRYSALLPPPSSDDDKKESTVTMPAALVTFSTNNHNSNNKKIRVIKDCTQRVVPDSPFFPGGQKPIVFSCCPAKRSSSSFSSSAASIVLSEDIGTHVDSPKHFFEDQRSISDLVSSSSSELLAPGVIIDVSEKAKDNHDYLVTVEDILECEEINKKRKIPKGALVCMRSGWSSRFHLGEDAYLNKKGGTDNKMHFPAFSPEAAKFLLEHRDVGGLGVDTLSPDAGFSEDFPVHQLMLGAGKYHVENMVLDGLPTCDDFYFLTAPLLVRGAYEAPCRCLALEFV